ncbi:60S ribosomal protein l3 [Grosmannia clavigera kw1407]|uniref:60S ribosomal protein l3 n=1 Tax=Grosmannia clavigera (strain kw1407 / UAMH 11150) TaxID=655863 RepID=F0XTW4_GROCL|nr:60S ribosomal protein l3 [Grosmannia clavigera kw1407]EFW98568.1 60S ribosomal protein l3 [Grosmannia clavigera kw1407]
MSLGYSTSATVGAAAAVEVALLLLLGKILYNLFFHPLRKYPGPLVNRASYLGYVYVLMRGDLPQKVLEWHEQYGPVIRIMPDQLSFVKPEAWKDIYGYNTGTEEMSKLQTFYNAVGGRSIVTEPLRGRHRNLRRLLAHGFSDRAMRDQEPLIAGYVDLLIQRLHERTLPEAVDMRTWYNWMAFDIIGDLAFGESFGSMDQVRYHPWVDAIANKVSTMGLFITATLLHLRRPLMLAAGLIFPGREEVESLAMQRVEKRMALGTERPDFLEGLLRQRKEDNMTLSIDDIAKNAEMLVLAGSETTATLLTGLTYLLLRNRAVLDRLTAEVRSSFASASEITLISVGKLPYMLACIDEGLRMYPPVPVGLPRVVPAAGAIIAGDFVPGGTVVSCSQWAMDHYSKHWVGPYDFTPERFLDGSMNAGDCREALQPFSLGPRSCIGRNLAYAEMRLVLARIIYDFDMRMVNPSLQWIDAQKSLILWDKPELSVYLEPVRKD